MAILRLQCNTAVSLTSTHARDDHHNTELPYLVHIRTLTVVLTSDNEPTNNADKTKTTVNNNRPVIYNRSVNTITITTAAIKI